jgi:hypothetical protein
VINSPTASIANRQCSFSSVIDARGANLERGEHREQLVLVDADVLRPLGTGPARGGPARGPLELGDEQGAVAAETREHVNGAEAQLELDGLECDEGRSAELTRALERSRANETATEILRRSRGTEGAWDIGLDFGR